MVATFVFLALAWQTSLPGPTPAWKQIAVQKASPTLRVRLVGFWEDPTDALHSYKQRLRLDLEQRKRGEWVRVTSAKVGQGTDAEGDDVRLSVGDLDGDGRIEICVTSLTNEAVRTEGEVFVFRLIGTKLRRIGYLSGDEGAETGDLNHDGRWEARVINDVGELSHAEQIRWPDHYAIKGDRLIRVNPSFPSTFSKERRPILEHLTRHPWDDEIWALYGLANRYSRTKETPRQAYTNVIRLSRAYYKNYKPEDDFIGEHKWFDQTIADLLIGAKKNRPFPKKGKRE